MKCYRFQEENDYQSSESYLLSYLYSIRFCEIRQGYSIFASGLFGFDFGCVEAIHISPRTGLRDTRKTGGYKHNVPNGTKGTQGLISTPGKALKYRQRNVPDFRFRLLRFFYNVTGVDCYTSLGFGNQIAKGISASV